MEYSSVSISNSVSMNDLKEDFSLFPASLNDAAGRDTDTLSNEQIRRGDWIIETYDVLSDAFPGGMGCVWRVFHQDWKTELAMKRPYPAYFAEAGKRKKEIFIRECENWIDLGLHPNIVSCFYVREIGGVPAIFSEWMDGGSLKDRIADGSLYEGPDGEIRERILDIAIQTARGLRFSHLKGFVHQDVKPGNLLLTKEWDAKVADFGLAQAISLQEAGSTRPSGFSPAYCPAEQMEGETPEPWMDLYAWALTVLEMYTGARLWNTGAEAAAHMDDYLSAVRIPTDGEVGCLLKDCVAGEIRDFAVAEECLTAVYRRLFGREYPRREQKEAVLTAEFLNNRALSFIDLGMPRKAEECWEHALAQDRENAEVHINVLLHQWRSGQKDKLLIYNALDDWYKATSDPEYRKAREEFEAESAVEVCTRKLKKPDGSTGEEAEPVPVRNAVDITYSELSDIPGGNVLVWRYPKLFVADAETGETIRVIAENTERKNWKWFPPKDRKLLLLSEGKLLIHDLVSGKTEPLPAPENICSFDTDLRRRRIMCCGSDGTVTVLDTEGRTLGTASLPLCRYNLGNMPSDWYTPVTEKGAEFRLAPGAVFFLQTDDVLVVRGTYIFRTELREWAYAWEQESYGDVPETEEEEADILFLDIETLEATDRRPERQGRPREEKDPLTREEVRVNMQPAWRIDFLPRSRLDAFPHSYRIFAPDSRQLIFTCDRAFVADPARRLIWTEPDRKIIRLPERIRRAPWRLCRIASPKMLYEKGQRAAEIENEFWDAVNRQDYETAICLYNEYGELPGRALSDAEGRMEDELAKHCLRSGVKGFGDCDFAMDREQVTFEKYFAGRNPAGIRFVDGMNQKGSPWMKEFTFGSRRYKPLEYRMQCSMRNCEVILVRNECRETFFSRRSFSSRQLFRYIILRIPDGRMLYESMDEKGAKAIMESMSMTPDGNWFFFRHERFHMPTLKKESFAEPGSAVTFRDYSFTPDSEFMFFWPKKLIIQNRTGKTWNMPQNWNKYNFSLVFSRNGRFAVWDEDNERKLYSSHDVFEMENGWENLRIPYRPPRDPKAWCRIRWEYSVRK